MKLKEDYFPSVDADAKIKSDKIPTGKVGKEEEEEVEESSDEESESEDDAEAKKKRAKEKIGFRDRKVGI